MASNEKKPYLTIWDSNLRLLHRRLNVKTLNRSTTPASIVLAILQRYQIIIVRQFFIDRIFKPGLLFSLSQWTRPTFDHSEVKIDL